MSKPTGASPREDLPAGAPFRGLRGEGPVTGRLGVATVPRVEWASSLVTSSRRINRSTVVSGSIRSAVICGTCAARARSSRSLPFSVAFQEGGPAVLGVRVPDDQPGLFHSGDQPGQAAGGEGEVLGEAGAGGTALRMPRQTQQHLELGPAEPGGLADRLVGPSAEGVGQAQDVAVKDDGLIVHKFTHKPDGTAIF